MKVGIIRCMQTEDFCPGTTDFRMIREKRDADRLCLSFRQKDEGCYPERFRRWHPADRLYALGRSGSWWKRHKKRGH